MAAIKTKSPRNSARRPRKTGGAPPAVAARRPAAVVSATVQLVADAGAALGQPELAEKIKDLVRLAQEQGKLTHNDITEAFPGRFLTPAALDEIYLTLQNLEVAIVDPAAFVAP